MGITLSEVMVSQGVDEGVDEAGATGVTVGCDDEDLAEREAWTDSIERTTAMLEAIAALEAGAEGASELVAMGITLSEVRVSQGVDEAGLEEATLEVGTTGAELEGRGAGLEG